MMVKTLTFNQDVSPLQWHPLPRAFKKGEKVYKFFGCDFGCVADDLHYGGFRTVAVQETNNDLAPFFTVPVAYLKDPTHD